MTRRSRGIHAAWHFWFAVSFGGVSGVRKLGLGGIHPLTQRYVQLTDVSGYKLKLECCVISLFEIFSEKLEA
ncbi:DUF3265 domain-containing protein [Vibrio vulnificus]|nr:DUF3265 domain-containing protein [Vibrio vulnificus]ELG4951797.1 DUF3265 domain-containing protein [Vibrio vulnificus]